MATIEPNDDPLARLEKRVETLTDRVLEMHEMIRKTTWPNRAPVTALAAGVWALVAVSIVSAVFYGCR